MSALVRKSLLVASLVALAGCSASASGSSSAGFSGPPYLTILSASGKLRLDLWTSPQPPVRGTLSTELRITSVEGGAPVDGLELAVVPWMPSMGHGSSVVPTVSETGNGTYIVSHLSLFMAGHWELQTSLSGTASDSATPALDIP
jgi:hypothetical protein